MSIVYRKFQTTIRYKGTEYLEGGIYGLDPEVASVVDTCTVPTTPPSNIPKGVTAGQLQDILSNPQPAALEAKEPAAKPEESYQPKPQESSLVLTDGSLSDERIAQVDPSLISSRRLNLDAISLSIADTTILTSIGAMTGKRILEFRPEAGFRDFETFKSLCKANDLSRIDFTAVENEVFFQR